MVNWQLIIVSDLSARFGTSTTALISNKPSLLSLTNLTSLLSSTLFMLQIVKLRAEREGRNNLKLEYFIVFCRHLHVMSKAILSFQYGTDKCRPTNHTLTIILVPDTHWKHYTWFAETRRRGQTHKYLKYSQAMSVYVRTTILSKSVR